MTYHVRRIQPLATAVCLLLAAMPAGCEDGKAGAPGSSMTEGSSASRNDRLSDSPDANLENAEWGEIDLSRSTSQAGPSTSVHMNVGGGGRRASLDPNAPNSQQPWTIVLATVSGEDIDERQVATDALQRMRELAPDVASARIIPAKSGVIIGYGAYADVRDAQAQRDLERIKNITVRGGKPFSGAVLTRVPTAAQVAPGRLHPHDLRAARALYPNVSPLYTLQVGVWSDFESGQISPERVRENAEKQAAELRARGHEAYFYHDDDQVISIVTVGLFDKSALQMDEQLRTPVVSPEVEMLLRKFPAHLVNGEAIEEPISLSKPSLGTRVQTPRLVLVP